MIPKNITSEFILKAIAKIDKEGVPSKRLSKKYNLRYMDKVYPPKYTVGLANLFANGTMLEPKDYSGGKETNCFLMDLGFEISSTEGMLEKRAVQKGVVEEHESKAVSSLVKEPVTVKPLHGEQSIKIATVIIESPEIKQPTNKERQSLLGDMIVRLGKSADVILLPAGFFKERRKADNLYSKVETFIIDMLGKADLDTMVCLGIDGRNGVDQIGLAINRNGIVSMARKFNPTDGERDYIDAAEDYLARENDCERIVEVKGKRLYLAICYDVYGINKRKLKNPKVDGILSLVHRFEPKGYGSSGDVYFAKCGFGGASKQWKCPVFGAVTFFQRTIPERWPSGVLWNQGDKKVSEWKYKENGIKPINEIEINSKYEKALIRFFLV